MTAWYERALDRGRFPDWLIRAGIRRRLASRLQRETRGGVEAVQARLTEFVRSLSSSPIAIETVAANEQHYELPPAFFEAFLGPRLKYSCGLWDSPDADLASSEEAMLARYAERARLADGQRVLDLGCGWGSFCLWASRRYPGARVLAVSNSSLQRAFIERRARELGVSNLEVRTADANTFEPGRRFDRVVSVEMLEHVKNYRAMFSRVASWLEPDGLFFAHVFAHMRIAYPFEREDDWIGRYFFTGGNMPSAELFLHFQEDLGLIERWIVGGEHYQRTAYAWLAKLDAARDRVMPVLRDAYGDQATAWWHRWRVFLMACAELWGFRGGGEWVVAHYLFRPRPQGDRP